MSDDILADLQRRYDDERRARVRAEAGAEQTLRELQVLQNALNEELQERPA